MPPLQTPLYWIFYLSPSMTLTKLTSHFPLPLSSQYSYLEPVLSEPRWMTWCSPHSAVHWETLPLKGMSFRATSVWSLVQQNSIFSFYLHTGQPIHESVSFSINLNVRTLLWPQVWVEALGSDTTVLITWEPGTATPVLVVLWRPAHTQSQP